jgi:hypothetical protein
MSSQKSIVLVEDNPSDLDLPKGPLPGSYLK